MNKPKLSVGLPVYNGERYLRNALESLLNQDFEDFELIISDNGSTDGTAEICDMYAKRDKRIRYFRSELNRGATWNFRRVLELAEGNYFKWATHDDECYPTMFRRCVEVLDHSGPDATMAYTRCEFIDENGALTRKDLEPKWDDISSSARKPHQRLARVLNFALYGHPIYGVIKIDFLKKTRPFGTVAADWVKLAELSMLGKIIEAPEVLYRLRLHPMNAMVSRSWRELLAWHDPSLSRKTLVLPKDLAFVMEYLKSVHYLPLPAGDKMCCYITACVTPLRRCLRCWFRRSFWPWLLHASGPARIKLRDVTGWNWLSRQPRAKERR